MARNNYFKCSDGQLFFFDDTVVEDITRALKGAREVSEEVSVYRITPIPGPWDRLSVIGHRKRGQIISDISNTADDSEDLPYLYNELALLDNAYYAAGRTSVPVQAVAA